MVSVHSNMIEGLRVSVLEAFYFFAGGRPHLGAG